MYCWWIVTIAEGCSSDAWSLWCEPANTNRREDPAKERKTLMRICFSSSNRIPVSFALIQRSHSYSYYLRYVCTMGGASKERKTNVWTNEINDRTRYLSEDKRSTLCLQIEKRWFWCWCCMCERRYCWTPATAIATGKKRWTFFGAIRFYRIQFDSWRWSVHKCLKITPETQGTKINNSTSRKSVEIFVPELEITSSSLNHKKKNWLFFCTFSHRYQTIKKQN